MADILKVFRECDSYLKYLGGGGLVIGLSAFAYMKMNAYQYRRHLRQMKEERQKSRTMDFARLRLQYPLTPEGIAIIRMSLEELRVNLQSRSLKVVDVLSAYIAKALEVTDSFNCVTEFIPQALEIAQALDREPEIKGKLHGMPICIKDDADVPGMDTTLGCAKNLNKPKSQFAPIVQVLIDCKTNVAQTLFAFCCHNPIFGETLNPLNPRLSPGGSSGGSGCLVRGGGAIAGTGSDIGGSLRIPAHFCGISTIHSTYRRISSKGVGDSNFLAWAPMNGVPGVMAKTPKVVASLFKALTEDCRQCKYDSNVVPIPWDNKTFESKARLRIGYYTSNLAFPALGNTEKTVLEAKSALEALGHTLIPFNFLCVGAKWWKLISDLVYSDGGKYAQELLAGEEISFSVKRFYDLIRMPIWWRRMKGFIYSIIPGQQGQAAMLRLGFDSLKSEELWGCMSLQLKYKEELKQAMDEEQLDLILCPVFPFPALSNRTCSELFGALHYTMYYNLMDFPAGVIPFGTESGKNIATYDCRKDPSLELAKRLTSF